MLVPALLFPKLMFCMSQPVAIFVMDQLLWNIRLFQISWGSVSIKEGGEVPVK